MIRHRLAVIVVVLARTLVGLIAKRRRLGCSKGKNAEASHQNASRCEMPHDRKSQRHLHHRTIPYSATESIDGLSSTVDIAFVRSSAKPDAIESKSILAEEFLAIRQRHIRGGLFEAAVEVIPRTFEAVYGKIRGKHTSIHAKDPDCLVNYRLIGCERPRLPQYRKARDLAVDVVWQCR